MSELPDSPSETGVEKLQTRWRIIPAGFLCLFDSLLVISCVIWLVAYAAGIRVSARPVSERVPHVTGILLSVCAGVLWTIAGICIWRSRWLWAAIGTLAGYGCGAFGNYLAFELTAP